MKRRYVLKNKKRFFSIIIVLAVLLSSIFLASSVYGYEIKQYDTITIESGDTLWEIAHRYNNGGDVRKVILEIKKANNMKSSEIFAGEELIVPLM